MASLLFVITLLQQASAPAGSIHGLVLTSERSPLTGARLELAGPQVTQVIRSDNEGRFSFANLAHGPYRLSVKK
ncbi:MAG TPA: carboxypeptidase-like regulatory domain-containing protein, partial [Terriglobia bacterium]|nr:carboxypeptidase-like regulatory domain-containing protein [Terriglobia bacterium]